MAETTSQYYLSHYYINGYCSFEISISFEVLEEEPDIVDPAAPVTEVANGDIEFRNVCFKYEEESELNNLDKINLKIKLKRQGALHLAFAACQRTLFDTLAGCQKGSCISPMRSRRRTWVR